MPHAQVHESSCWGDADEERESYHNLLSWYMIKDKLVQDFKHRGEYFNEELLAFNSRVSKKHSRVSQKKSDLILIWTLSSLRISDHITKLREVLEEDSFSDHNYIQCPINDH